MRVGRADRQSGGRASRLKDRMVLGDSWPSCACGRSLGLMAQGREDTGEASRARLRRALPTIHDNNSLRG